MSGKIMGIDIGGTRMRIGLVDEKNQVCRSRIVSSSRITERGTAVEDLLSFIGEYMEEWEEKPEAIAVGVPGPVQKDGRTVYCAPNLLDSRGRHVLDGVDLAAPLEQEFGIPAFINKDTNFLLFYDRQALKLEDREIIAAGYIGTGYGGGVLIDGRLLTGRNGVAMDLGHVPFYHSSARCNCGKLGCAEAHASGTVLKRIWQEQFPDTDFGRLFTEHGETDILKEFVYCCALPFAMLGTIFAPDVYIAGGGVLEMADFPKNYFEQCLREQAGHAVTEGGIDLRYSREDQEKGIIGGAIYARSGMGESV